jgi:ATP-dependent 26S proteasome regulatory subunit
VILFEDIDRAFPRAGKSEAKVSLQTLLNCLDGVASAEGIITVATANEPTALDPAILRRPGRFDRVVLFSNPSPELRHAYFVNLNPDLAEEHLESAVSCSEGFSFAQLREAYIMAGQYAFTEGREVSVEDLFHGVCSLRKTTLSSSLRGIPTGFATTAI